MPVGPGDELLFRDHGRDFYGFIILGPRAPKSRARQAAWILNSLRVQAAFRSP